MGIAEPRVTIVVSLRERWALTEAAIDSIVAGTALPYRLVWLDVGAPEWLRTTIAGRAAEWRLEVLRYDGLDWPQQARARYVAEHPPTTDYTVFVDNDVEVQPGWLDALVACADETGAGIVGPLYLWSDGVAEPRIHMAGGSLVERATPRGIAYDESHQLLDADYRANAHRLKREPCGFLEYHCMLVRSSLLREAGVVDADMLCVHEHIDLCLEARKRGMPILFEPGAVITYLAFAEYMLDDLPMLRHRWNAADVERSIARFCARWNSPDDERAFAGIRGFARSHLADIDPLRPNAVVDRASPMAARELAQTRAALLDQAQAAGYDADALGWLNEAWQLGQLLLDGGYRPCGRPFLNHLAGTASVLVRYGFRAELVVAGLLHAAYTHCPRHPLGDAAALAAVTGALGGAGSSVERRVRAYTLRNPATVVADASELFVGDAELLAMAAANGVDMHLSGELRYSGRSDELTPQAFASVEHACAVLGVPGLALTLREARANFRAAASALVTGRDASYRISADKQQLEPLWSNVPRLLVAPA